jgi:hypothetical protein
MPEHDHMTLRCSHCGDRLGVYEPFLVQEEDGELRSSSYLNLSAGERAAPPPLWHPHCFGADAGSRMR